MIRRKRPPLRGRELIVLVGMGILVLAILSGLLYADVRWSSMISGGGRFYSSWAAARTFLVRGGEPYGATSAFEAQVLAYGRPAHQDENPYWLDLPFFLLPFYFPIALVPDATLARGLWALASQLALVGAMLLTMRVIEWSPPRLVVVLSAVTLVFSYYSVAALIEGSAVIFLCLIYISMLWALKEARDEWAGALGALGLFLWEAGLVYLLFITWRVFHDRRWRVLAGFGMALAILLLIAFLLDPGWFMPFLIASVGMLRSNAGISSSAALLRLVPDGGRAIARVLSILMSGMILYEWAISRGADFRGFTWTACLVLAATPLLGIRTELSNLVVLIPSLALIFSVAIQKGSRYGWFGVLFMAASFVVPWLLRMTTAGTTAEGDLLFLFLPCLTVMGLYWIRWRFLRPARTWLDEVRAAGG